ncbi:hypothetical protein U0C82_16730 [Fulvimarina sp. 2208YS6-2-32]|uniref:Uncharacterized protein n=1 Tax=Fulvimarina uroteuthidis TaxID=3098149 RepID=A0ABU5I5W6_9HYPH|nr:hypothetical protein [Fulvimarina sp. 2208YS6-2-32]MDY8110788.1 hypothetical protein [Fulvimarina sp. 2208YS6-2-32]
MASQVRHILAAFPQGNLIPLDLAAGLKVLPDGRVIIIDSNNDVLIMFDPADFEGVERSLVLETLRRLLTAISRGKVVELPEWLQ